VITRNSSPRRLFNFFSQKNILHTLATTSSIATADGESHSENYLEAVMKKVFFSIGLALSLVSAVGCYKPKRTSSATIKDINPKPGPDIVKETPKDPDKVNPKHDGNFEPIFFSFDESGLSHESMLRLDEIAVFLEENPKATIRIAGHADERGTEEYNLALGQERAESVKRYLTLQRIDPARINTVSYGEEIPLSEGFEEEDLAKNRRAEFTVGGAVLAENTVPVKKVPALDPSKKMIIQRLGAK
jgi:peptidoglycan-associated lipoprotein